MSQPRAEQCQQSRCTVASVAAAEKQGICGSQPANAAVRRSGGLRRARGGRLVASLQLQRKMLLSGFCFAVGDLEFRSRVVVACGKGRFCQRFWRCRRSKQGRAKEDSVHLPVPRRGPNAASSGLFTDAPSHVSAGCLWPRSGVHYCRPVTAPEGRPAARARGSGVWGGQDSKDTDICDFAKRYA